MRVARVNAARVALTLALVLYGWLAIGSGLDRLSAQAPALERLVPGPFRASAERSAAMLAGARGRRAALMSHARAAVSADPVDPGAASLLGAARLLQGDNAGAEQAFRVAARFGWRDVPTQAYWFEAAMEGGQVEPAADRLDALLRANPTLPGSEGMLARLEATPAGRTALEERMAARPDWLPSYLQTAGLAGAELDRRSTVLAELAGRGTRLGCAESAPFVTGALYVGARRQAERVWLSHCPGATLAGGIADAGFDGFGMAQASPFGWQVLPSGDVSIEPVQAAGGEHAVRMSNRASVSRLVLMQSVRLPAGTYRVTAKTRPGALSASLGCGQVPALPRGVTGDIGGGGQVIEVPACDRLMLGLWLRGGSDGVELDDVRLNALR